MIVIRAHFDGRVVVPDEPVHLARESQVMVMIDGEAGEAEAALEQATREYYQQQSAEEKVEDEAWGKGAAADAGKAWE